MFLASLQTTTTWVARLLSSPARFSIPRPLTRQATRLALQDSTKIWSPRPMPSSMLPHAGLANLLWLELPQTISQSTTAPQHSVPATSAPRHLQSPTGEVVMHPCSLMTHMWWYSPRWQVTSSPPATLATASTGTALHGPPKRTSTRTRSALCTDSGSTRINPSTSQPLGTTMADCAYPKKCTTLQTSEPQ